jgi:hypothetical protein
VEHVGEIEAAGGGGGYEFTVTGIEKLGLFAGAFHPGASDVIFKLHGAKVECSMINGQCSSLNVQRRRSLEH